MNNIILIKKRKEKKLTQDEVANQIGVKRSAYCNYEIGRRTPSVKISKKIGKILEFDWTKIYEEEKGAENENSGMSI